MIHLLLRKSLNRFARQHDYDAGYMVEVLEVDPAAIVKLAFARGFLSHRGGLRPELWHAARLRSTMAADCGPCLALGVRLAEEDGVDRETIKQVLSGEAEDAEVRLVVAYADAVAAAAPEAGTLVAAARDRFGLRGLNALSIAVVSGQVYPTYKRGLGRAPTCLPVLKALDVA